ncbi:MAG: hypothetical protein K2K96_04715 [Lachnospiraceae bacterium]|nr:hypothetical protein [Lachnospiraceae bacterium]
MNKRTILLISCIVAITVLLVVRAVLIKNMNNDSDAFRGGDGTSRIQSFSNQGDTYTLKLDSYVTFSDSTSRSSVNDEDGLEVNYSDTYITIQRFPSSSFEDDFQRFLTFIKENTSMGSIDVTDCDLIIENYAVTDYEAFYLNMSGFTGYLIYMRTDNGMYKLLVSGSDEDIIEHYKTFVNDMEFR